MLSLALPLWRLPRPYTSQQNPKPNCSLTVWRTCHHRFFDVRILDRAPSNCTSTPSACYRRRENKKKRAYEQLIRDVEHASFTPLVFSTTGGMGKIATTAYKHLADWLASEWGFPYSETIGWLRCSLSFSLLHSSIQYCIRGACMLVQRACNKDPILHWLVHSESRFILA